MTGFKHGYARPDHRAPEYRSWEGARGRCRNPNNPDFARYGGRGITFDPAWDAFEDFLADMGPRPPGTTLDRIDRDGPYTAVNCRWADGKTQGRNKRDNHMVVHAGRSMTMVELAEITGLPYRLLSDRIARNGWSVERAISEPVRRW